MKTAEIVLKKELARFWSNKVSAISSILLPGLLIFALWSVMGDIMQAKVESDTNIITVAAVNLPTSVETGLSSSDIEFIRIDSLPNENDMNKATKTDETNLYALFPQNFDEQIGKYKFLSNAELIHPLSNPGAMQIEVFYNSANTSSLKAYEAICSALDSYESSILNVFDVNSLNKNYDLATEKDKASFMAVTLIPFMLLTLIFTACMSVTAESIAGEKERGTLATLLTTPTKRWQLALGKIAACVIIGAAIALSSILGIFASLPKIMQNEINMGVYGPSEYVLIGVVVLSVTLLVVVIIMLVSACAKTTKDAQMMLMPVMIVIMGIGLLGMAENGVQTMGWIYLIPIYNAVEALISVLSFEAQIANILICVLSNLVYACIGSAVLGKLLSNEHLMFAR